jgi:hypothetical protein
MLHVDLSSDTTVILSCGGEIKAALPDLYFARVDADGRLLTMRGTNAAMKIAVRALAIDYVIARFGPGRPRFFVKWAQGAEQELLRDALDDPSP